MSGITSTVSTLISFPGQGSIPPACFYNAQGLAGWLNKNSSYKLLFAYANPPIFYYERTPVLIPPEDVPSTLSSLKYDQRSVPLCSNVTTLSQNQAFKYQNQLALFQKVYSINSNAYISSLITGEPPIYYTFSTFQEKYDLNSAVALVNKLYPFQSMASVPFVNWQVPFPIGM
jgi:hypothetical protein